MAVRLTERDERLLVTLVRVRFLSRDQIAQLFFDGVSESAVRRRLRKLTSAGGPRQRPLLRRVTAVLWRERVHLYCLTTEGARHATLLTGEEHGPPPGKEGSVRNFVYEGVAVSTC